jgi:hypothetical protein
LQVVLRMMEEVQSEELIRAWSKKMAPPLVTLLSAEPEVQYVALRNINLIVQRWPGILAHEVKVRVRFSVCAWWPEWGGGRDGVCVFLGGGGASSGGAGMGDVVCAHTHTT